MQLELPQEYNPRHNRIRCFGHIINLTVKAFLNVSDSDNLDDNTTITVEQIEIWRRKGPLGKLHNLAIKLRSSTQIYDKFKAISRGATLPQDNSTR